MSPTVSQWVMCSERLPDKFITKYGTVINHSDEVLVLVNYEKFPEEEGEIYIGYFKHDLYDTYQSDIKENGERFDINIEKESWVIYNKGTSTPYVELYNKNVVAWQPLPKAIEL